MKTLDIFIDGSCLGNPGPGGYCVLIKNNNCYEKIISAGYYLTTNNRMEIMSAIIALEIKYLKNYYLNITTDSQYLRKGITTWIFQWEKNSWKKSNNQKIKNIDLWTRLNKLTNYHRIHWKWIKGHSGCNDHEYCDKLARSAALRPYLEDSDYLKMFH